MKFDFGSLMDMTIMASLQKENTKMTAAMNVLLKRGIHAFEALQILTELATVLQPDVEETDDDQQ